MVIFEEEPYCHVLANAKFDGHCHKCLVRSSGKVTLLRCARCKVIRYCDANCQKLDWKLHRRECEMLQENEAEPDKVSEAIRIILRMAIKWREGDFGEVDINGIPRSLVTLVEHEKDASLELLSYRFLNEFNSVVKKRIVGDDVIRRLFKKLSVNSFGISDEFGQNIGVGLFMRLSYVEHSCKPNSRVVYEKNMCKLMPVDPRKPAASLEELSHSYIDELTPRDERRQALKAKYMFDCKCEGCLDEERNNKMEAWECQECANGWLEAKEETYCRMCKAIPDEGYVQSCLISTQAAISGNQQLSRTDLPMSTKTLLAEKLKENMEDCMYKYNVRRLPVLHQLYKSALNDKEFDKAIDLGLEYVDVMQHYRSGLDVPICLLKYGIAELCLKQERFDKFKAIFTGDVIDVIRQSFGSDSEIYTKCQIMLRSAV